MPKDVECVKMVLLAIFVQYLHVELYLPQKVQSETLVVRQQLEERCDR
jgi:hypothetical protein